MMSNLQCLHHPCLVLLQTTSMWLLSNDMRSVCAVVELLEVEEQ